VEDAMIWDCEFLPVVGIALYVCTYVLLRELDDHEKKKIDLKESCRIQASCA
jgi:hypothetical protein